MKPGVRPERRRVFIGALTVVLAVVGACGGGSEESDLVAERFASLSIDALRESPTGEFRYLDIDAAAAAAGVAPTVDTIAAQGSDGLGLPSSWLFPDGWAAADAAVADELGWTLADASWLVEFSTPPAVVAVGDVDVADAHLDDILGARDEDGIWRLGPAVDLEIDETDRTPLRRFGETLRQARSGDKLFVARAVEPLRSVRDLDGDSVLTDPTVLDLTERLDAAQTYGAVVIVGPRSSDNGVSAAPFAGLAVGVSGPAEGRVTRIYFLHPSQDDASAHADALDQVLESRPVAREVAAWSVVADGSVVVIDLQHDSDTPTDIGFDLVLRADPVTTHR